MLESLDLDETPNYSAFLPDQICLHMEQVVSGWLRVKYAGFVLLCLFISRNYCFALLGLIFSNTLYNLEAAAYSIGSNTNHVLSCFVCSCSCHLCIGGLKVFSYM